jgi:hypothetical protein
MNGLSFHPTERAKMRYPRTHDFFTALGFFDMDSVPIGANK